MIYIFITVCSDNYDKCELWAVEGECGTNPEFMLRNCRKACGGCGPAPNRTPKPNLRPTPKLSTQPTELTTAAGKTYSFIYFFHLEEYIIKRQ